MFHLKIILVYNHHILKQYLLIYFFKQHIPVDQILKVLNKYNQSICSTTAYKYTIIKKQKTKLAIIGKEI